MPEFVLTTVDGKVTRFSTSENVTPGQLARGAVDNGFLLIDDSDRAIMAQAIVSIALRKPKR